MAEIYTDCNSEEGITIGLIDSILTISKVLRNRNLDSPVILEALKDLRESIKYLTDENSN